LSHARAANCMVVCVSCNLAEVLLMTDFVTELVAGVIALLIGVIVFGGFLGFLVLLLWNYLIPELFGLPQIDIFQAIGLFLLCSVLFKSSVRTSKFY
jgi:uncharacterized membrane protein required for colicin V production